MITPCPSPEDLSAYIDGELPADVHARTAMHLASCAACAAIHAELHELSAAFATLPDERLDFDLSQVIRGRIEALPIRREPGRRSRWRAMNWQRLLPVGAAAVASLSLGLALGTSLVAPIAVAPNPLQVFAPIAPGGLCPGLGSCSRPAATSRQLR